MESFGKYKFFYILSFIYISYIFSCKDIHEVKDHHIITKSATGQKAMVVTAHPLATKIGLEILQKGGNAIDAAIAVQFALAVCYPGAGNIGGGGFMIYRGADGQVSALDYREKAPLKAQENMYLDENGNPKLDKSVYGHLAVGVPGTVDGMVKAFERYSVLKDWGALVQPAVGIAENGFYITENEANNLNKNQELFSKNNRFKTVFQKNLWKKDDLLVQKELANTLESIKTNQRSGFYDGGVAEKIIEEMKAGGGLISKEDLEKYESIWREPIVGYYRDHKIISMPPPSSGGIALLQLLKMVEPYDLPNMKFHQPATVHLMVEAERRVYADRAKYLGDPDFYNVPVKVLLDSIYLVNRMKDFDPRLASRSDSITFGMIESPETTHFSIVDEMGNAVSMTTTLNGGYGSYTVVQGAGFLLNNEMDDFSIKPGVANIYGLVGSEANKIEPQKRMLSSMTPTIIEKEGDLFMVVGSPGGSTIITSVFQTIVNVIDFGMSAIEAVHSPRFHHQWLPDELRIEDDCLSESTRMVLTSLGHHIVTKDKIGRVEAIVIRPDGTMEGAADIRGDDDAKGY